MRSLEEENVLFRKFYAGNMANGANNETPEIKEAFSSLSKAFKTKDNFINRGIEDLSNVINKNLSNR